MSELRKGSIVEIHRYFDAEPEQWIFRGVKSGSRTPPQLIVRDLCNGADQLIPFVEIERIETSRFNTDPPPVRRRPATVIIAV